MSRLQFVIQLQVLGTLWNTHYQSSEWSDSITVRMLLWSFYLSLSPSTYFLTSLFLPTAGTFYPSTPHFPGGILTSNRFILSSALAFLSISNIPRLLSPDPPRMNDIYCICGSFCPAPLCLHCSHSNTHYNECAQHQGLSLCPLFCQTPNHNHWWKTETECVICEFRRLHCERQQNMRVNLLLIISHGCNHHHHQQQTWACFCRCEFEI